MDDTDLTPEQKLIIIMALTFGFLFGMIVAKATFIQDEKK